jgi:hypothetical protein
VSSWIGSCRFDGATVAARRGVGGVDDWRLKRSVLLPNSAKLWPIARVGESIIECGEVRTENFGDGVRGGAKPGDTEAGGLDELAGDSGGGEAELCKEVVEAAWPSGA